MSQTQEKGGAEGARSEVRSAYRATLNLPRTSFPMKANLVQNEPSSLKRWEAMGLYARVRVARAGREKFVFHDGPPYANGSIHLGHLMNKSLKDFVVRSRTMMGLDCPFVPGWDCHGLPIEHKVMQELEEKGRLARLSGLPEEQRRLAVRRECRAYAEKYMGLHIRQMTRLLTLADYGQPYMTMSPEYESATLEVLATLLERGLVYRALKPVHWSPANETALADAELEYHDRQDPSVYVDFEAADPGAVYDAFGLVTAGEGEEEEGEPTPGRRPAITPSFMIWTTTPWTLPANLAIAVNPKFEYALTWMDGAVSVVAKEAVERVARLGKVERLVVLATATGDRLVGLRYRHPFVERLPEFPASAGGEALRCYRVVSAEYVTLEDGTGLVHTAPGHGEEDYQTGQREGLPVYCPVRENGKYDESVPEWLRGEEIWNANERIVDRLRQSGHLFHEHTITHSYPHDWRSRTPVIFRCTEQWFVGVDREFEAEGTRGSLRGRALEATEHEVGFVPEWGRNRMRGMLQSRPDWCISRQRSWGLPIPALVLEDGTVFMTASSVRSAARVVAEKGSDAWYTLGVSELFAGYDPAGDPDAPAALRRDPGMLSRARKGGDILDVWFESGSSWQAVMRRRGLGYPADLYLEGSDQHRGWFQLSLLPALGVTGRPPFRTLLTHGFMVDKEGKKLSKSRPDAHLYEVDRLFADFGVDVMRWWVSSLPYENDVKVDREFFEVAGESYRKVRNTLRFMLSNLDDFRPDAHAVPVDRFPPTSPDAWVLAEFDRVVEGVVSAYGGYNFRHVHQSIYDFCNATLSAVYLAAVKDRLYCDRPDSPRRRRTQSALWIMTDGLCRLLAPILCHTADEAYRVLHRCPPEDLSRSVHLEEFPSPTGARADGRWTRLMDLRSAALSALERAKSELGIDNPLDAGVVLPDHEGLGSAFEAADAADLLGVSRVWFDASASAPTVRDLRAEARCERSWKRDGTVKRRADGGMLSDRDAAAVGVA